MAILPILPSPEEIMSAEYSWSAEIADQTAAMKADIAEACREAKNYKHLVSFTDAIDKGHLKKDNGPRNFIAHAAMIKLFIDEGVHEPYVNPDSELRLVEEETTSGWEVRMRSPIRPYGVFRVEYQQLGKQVGKQTVSYSRIHTSEPEATWEPIVVPQPNKSRFRPRLKERKR